MSMTLIVHYMTSSVSRQDDTILLARVDPLCPVRK